ncbi:SDR family oxidoreductase [Microbacterium sp. C7(2022)]|uniref:SDR family oxidoreductase n=1 Tax=Microbacterium sp. C7(2022) TaxID=2992759 RepID=UPI00237BA5C4|nr:SDR family oxidoreductase [Microbacterium sp. C7(2022)]MDE0545164.1 SDR family oxidoreductase [Microbacterium sp. C7(2022)]
MDAATDPAVPAPSGPRAGVPARRWHIDLPDLHGRTALVTGASDGVGFEIARAMAGAGAHLIMPVRNRPKGEQVADRLRTEHRDAQLEVRDLDLASLASVRTLADDLRAEGRCIHHLVLNAGVVMLGDPRRYLTVDGNELHLQTNAVGHAVLVAGILPLLAASRARVAVQCSLAAQRTRFAWDDAQSARDYRPLRAYARSKVLLGTFALELARRNERFGWGVRTVLCHPGVAMTNIAPAAVRARVTVRDRATRSLMSRGIFGHHPGDAALPALRATCDDAVHEGDFIVPARLGETNGPPKVRAPYASFTDPADGERALELLAEMAGVRLPDDLTREPAG